MLCIRTYYILYRLYVNWAGKKRRFCAGFACTLYRIRCIHARTPVIHQLLCLQPRNTWTRDIVFCYFARPTDDGPMHLLCGERVTPTTPENRYAILCIICITCTLMRFRCAFASVRARFALKLIRLRQIVRNECARTGREEKLIKLTIIQTPARRSL